MFSLRKSILGLFGACFLSADVLAGSAIFNLAISEDATAVSVGYRKPIQPPFAFLRSPNITTAIEFSLGRWEGRKSDQERRLLADFSVLPLVRYYPGGAAEGRFFVEGGIGGHLLSHVRLHRDLHFSTAFQFGDVVGTGWRLGEKRDCEMGLRFQHVSNASIKRPNQGINFIELRVVVPL